MLRIESLYQRAEFFKSRDDAEEHHVAILTLFEILDVASRADLKSEIMQELERKKHQLDALKGNPSVEQEKLSAIIDETEQAIAGLFTTSGKTGQELRENEWLMAIRPRTAIPGGVCEFDLPSYHRWMHLSPAQRRADLEQWLAPFDPIRAGASLVLRLLRESGKTSPQTASQGKFQQMLVGRLAQMLRLKLEESYDCIPEVSANKYAINIRFSTMVDSHRKTWEDDVDFELTFCNL